MEPKKTHQERMNEALFGPNANKSDVGLAVRMGISTTLLFAVMMVTLNLLGLGAYWLGTWFIIAGPIAAWDSWACYQDRQDKD